MKNIALCWALALPFLLAACGGDSSSSAPVAGGNQPTPPQPEPEPGPQIGQGEIRVLSNRADLISGGDALIGVRADDPALLEGAHLLVNGEPARAELADDGEGGLKGLVSGLVLGENRLRVVLADKSVLERTVTNHPNGGPVFSGPQVQPWNCTNEAAEDAQCNQPPEYRFKYVPASRLQALITGFDPMNPGLPSSFRDYDPENPPAAGDIAMVTTDQGVEVPYIVRVETGVQNRDRYQIMTLFDPEQQWDALNPQEQWNGKLLIHHGGNVGVSYGMGDPPNGDLAGLAPEGAELLLGDSITTALGRGFMTLSTAQGNLGHNANLVTAAESLMMAKERIVEQYGEIRYTIGTGCSGGSITQQHVANAYPGIYQGLIVQCSYPDVWTTATQFADYHLLRRFFRNQYGLPESQDGSDEGSVPDSLLSHVPVLQWSPFYGHLPLNPVISDLAFFTSAFPDQENCPGLKDGVTVYHRDDAPDGLRCGLLDYMKNQFGTRSPEVWTANESLLSRGFTGIPLDNVGVQYGLKALQKGLITGEQFLAVNREIGGLDVDIDPQLGRTVADPQALENSYRTGAINTAQHLANVPIIDLRGPDPGFAHDAFHSWQMRARLQAEQGHTQNHVIWFSLLPLAGDTVFTTEALLVMDLWLAEIEADPAPTPVAQKVIDRRPVQARDRCLSLSGVFAEEPIIPFTGNLLYPDPIIPRLDLSLLSAVPAEVGVVLDAVTGQVCGLDVGGLLEDVLAASGPLERLLGPLLEPLAAVTGPLEIITGPLADVQALVVQTRFGTPRTVAGDDIRTLNNKCQLKPVDPADYPLLAGISDSQAFADRVAEIFPDGVCDFSRPGVGSVPTETWLTYGDEERVIFGGEPLDDRDARDSRDGWAAPAFQVGL